MSGQAAAKVATKVAVHNTGHRGAVASAGPPPRHRSLTHRLTGGNSPTLFLFAVPALVVTIAFFIIPTFQGFIYSITDWNGFSADFKWVGLGNFTRILTGSDDLFTGALTNNLKLLVVVVVAQTALALVLALLLVENSRTTTALRALYFVPTILASVSVAFAWRFVYDPNFGLANTLLGFVGLDSLKGAYIGSAEYGIYFVAIAQVWAHAGQVMVIYVAGLQQIPVELYEAAKVDGVSRWQNFRYITWPMALPATLIVIAYTTIQSFKAFDLILGLGGNPPQSNIDILSTRIYSGFATQKFGYAAAESILFMLLIIIVTVGQRRAARATTAQA